MPVVVLPARSVAVTATGAAGGNGKWRWNVVPVHSTFAPSAVRVTGSFTLPSTVTGWSIAAVAVTGGTWSAGAALSTVNERVLLTVPKSSRSAVTSKW